jgi:lysozyme
MSVTAPTNLIGILNAIPPYLLTEASRTPDAPTGSAEASLTPIQRQPRLSTELVIPSGATSAVARMQIDATGINMLQEFEGLRLAAYWDPYGHCWTIGFGETSGVHQGEVWTYTQCVDDLRNRLAADYEPAIWNLGVSLNQHQFDALCDFVWNLGPGSMQWNVGQLLRAGNYVGAADAMLEYDVAGGVVLAGLRARREAERALFLTPMPPPPDPHHYDRFPILETFNGRRWDERTYVERYDEYRAHWIKDRKQLKISKGYMGELAKHVYEAAHDVPKGHKPDWDSFYRGWRFQELTHRSEGKAVSS